MAKEKYLTPAIVDGLICVRILDAAVPGLLIEALPSGRKRWQYRRRVAGTKTVVKMNLGAFPLHSIAAARDWAIQLNAQVEAGIDPREARRAKQAHAAMTVARAHALYMRAVHEGRSSRAKRPNKPRTISDKLEIYDRDVAPALADKIIYDVTEADLVKLVEKKGRTARVRANRLAAELKVFFGWASSLRGTEVGFEIDPSRRLGDLRFPETARSRKLSLQEIEWFLLALVDEERDFRRGMLAWLLTAARISEVGFAHRD